MTTVHLALSTFIKMEVVLDLVFGALDLYIKMELNSFLKSFQV